MQVLNGLMDNIFKVSIELFKVDNSKISAILTDVLLAYFQKMTIMHENDLSMFQDVLETVESKLKFPAWFNI